MQVTRPVRYALLLAIMASAGALVPLSVANAATMGCAVAGDTPNSCISIEDVDENVRNVKAGVRLAPGQDVQGYFRYFNAQTGTELSPRTDNQGYSHGDYASRPKVFWAPAISVADYERSRVCAQFVETQPDRQAHRPACGR